MASQERDDDDPASGSSTYFPPYEETAEPSSATTPTFAHSAEDQHLLRSAYEPAAPAPAEETSFAAAAVARLKKEKGRVRFNSNAAATPPLAPPPDAHVSGTGLGPPAEITEPASPRQGRPKPSILRGKSPDHQGRQDARAPDAAEAAAQERARLVAARVQRNDQNPDPTSPHARLSFESDASGTTASNAELISSNRYTQDIPLQDMSSPNRNWHDQTSQELEEGKSSTTKQGQLNQAQELVRAHTRRYAGGAGKHASPQESVAGPSHSNPTTSPPPAADGPPFPELTKTASRREYDEINDGNYDGLYNVEAPKQYHGNVLSQLLRLYNQAGPEGSASASAPGNPFNHHRNTSTASFFSNSGGGGSGQKSPGTPGSSGGTGATTPTRRKWYDQNRSQDTLVNLIGASAKLANPAEASSDSKAKDTPKKRPPMHKRNGSGSRLSMLFQQREDEQQRITVHIAEILSRQEYVIQLCRALMLFGAPTHRLEEYLSTTANMLAIDGQFLYLPGCMIVSFDDKSTHTTEVRMVRNAQGIDLGKLKDTHAIYKEVIHDVISAEEGVERLKNLMDKKDKFHAWIRVFVFGLTSVTAAPFSFSARFIDLPIIFFLGSLVGFLQLIIATKSQLYSNVLEVSATVLVSFLARAFGSINDGKLFCFSALAQSGIVMLLPGYAVLCSALELQSRAMVPGSIRIVYAIIYSLLLGFGITVGAMVYGLFDANAVSTTKCEEPLNPLYGFGFVPLFVLCISMLYQAKWRQMPIMVVVAFAGYVVNHFSGKRFAAAPQIANTLGAFTVGVLANLYSRIRHGVAAAILIPAIFTQVPGGLASTGGLLSGLQLANELTNATKEVHDDDGVVNSDGDNLNTVVFNVAASMIQIAIGIAVGLFISALVIYPLGKRRSGLFSF